MDGRFAIIGYPNLTECAKDLCRVMQYDIDVFTLSSDMDVRDRLSKLAAEGIGTFVCDMIVSTIAQEMGLNAILVLSGTESITNVFNQAVHLSRAYNYIRRQREMLKIIFAESERNVCVYYPDGRLWFSTLSKDDEVILDQRIRSSFFPFRQEKDYKVELTEGNVLHTFHFRSIEAFCQRYIMAFHASRELYPVDDSVDDISLFSENSGQTADVASGISIGTGTLRQKILAFAKTSYPVFIVGEEGCEKNQIATLLYKESAYSQGHYYIINCGLLGQKRWHYLLNHCDSPLFDAGCTVFFRGVEKLAETQISELIDFLCQGVIEKSIRLLFSIDTDSSNFSKTLSALEAALRGVRLNIPPLRERRDEINTMAIMYLNYMNRELGKEIIGFEKQAIERIRDFPWPHNIRQFRRVIRQISILTSGNYVATDTVREVLNAEGNFLLHPISNGTATIDITRPLEEIEVSIVKAVLEQNNMNQTKTAEQLKISRSKLWRMLK